MDAQTHLQTNPELVGVPVELGEGTATVKLATSEAMSVDERGLIHGGFVFGVADYAAMLAVNHPNVVLGASDCRFVAPVRAGDELLAKARITGESGKKRTVEAQVSSAEKPVFTGTFICFVLEQHVLDDKE